MSRSVSILVVEANPDHQLLIGYSLRTCIPRAEPLFVATADEALSYLDECPMHNKYFPTLVLLGIDPPLSESAGYLLTEIRQRYPALLVLVLSTQENPALIRQIYESGAHSFLVKPHDLDGWERQFQLLALYWLGVATLPSLER